MKRIRSKEFLKKHSALYYHRHRAEVLARTQRNRTAPKGRYTRARVQAIGRGLCWEISEEFFVKNIALPCFYCNDTTGKTGSSLDRIDNTAGYLESNVVPCCGQCNKFRRRFVSLDEMVAIVDLLQALRGKQRIWT